MSHNLLIRADASASIGTGHVMRCLALAQAWRRSGGSVSFAVAEITSALQTRLLREGFETLHLNVKQGGDQDAANTAETARRQDADWIVVDGYHFGAGYQRIIKDAGIHLLFVDDYGHADDYCADLVLNQDLTADASLYARREPHTQLLVGPRYTLLREEFLPWRDWKREVPAISRNVLVTLGGADQDNVTGNVIAVLKQFPKIEIKVVVGGSNPHLEHLKSEIGSAHCENRKSEIELVLDATNMPELMAWADVAVSAGGSTCWEFCFMGLPSLTILLAENQRINSLLLEKAGTSICLGWHNQIDGDTLANDLRSLLNDAFKRQSMSRKGRSMVDGLGAERVVALMRDGRETNNSNQGKA